MFISVHHGDEIAEGQTGQFLIDEKMGHAIL